MVEEPDVLDLITTAREIGDALEQHSVFGTIPGHITAENKVSVQRWITHEKAHFISMVLLQALDPLARNPKIFKYNDSLAMVKLEVEEKEGVMVLSSLTVTPRPDVLHDLETQLDYEAINATVGYILERRR